MKIIKYHKKNQGFTLIELMVVIVIAVVIITATTN
ncbi:MAG: type II secretion system protein, partial [Halanaerobiales bacterium]